MRNSNRLLAALLIGVAVVFVWSGIGPYDRFTWLLEVLPVVLALPVLFLLRRRMPFTSMVYVLIALHMGVLMVGGHWTYARVPLFDWIRDTFGLARNHYDRVGHFLQGFVPALITREVLLRTTPLHRGRMLSFLCLMVCLGLSAVYELVEWGVAEATGSAADDFLGTQGDVWDTQSDMAMCGIGALAALALLSRRHDRELARMPAAKDRARPCVY